MRNLVAREIFGTIYTLSYTLSYRLSCKLSYSLGCVLAASFACMLASTGSVWSQDLQSPCGGDISWVAAGEISAGSVKITQFRRGSESAEELWKQYNDCLLVASEEVQRAVQLPGQTTMELGEFIGDNTVLVAMTFLSYAATYALDISTGELKLIGGGFGAPVADDGGETLIYLSHQKRYRPGGEGAYWIDALVTATGEPVEFISTGESECIRVSDILGPEESTARLRQPLDACVSYFY